MHENSLRLSEYKARVSHLQPHFPSESNIDSNAERKRWFSQKHNELKSLTPIITCVIFLYQPPTYDENNDKKRNVKTAHPILLHFSSSLSIGGLTVAWYNMHTTRIEIKTANFELICALFYCSSKNKIHIHIRATKYEISDFRDSTYYLPLKLTQHNIKINGRVHANKFSFKFFFTQNSIKWK